ncbi:ATP-binding SpoIIE family protein phosphatase [Streptomyces sp. CA-106131]|uniref:ATP-binding SpoIIE family protein phosphatase n=1 Tax=Streptomyces sp. CA-106131 TaxID=3240045 RepID=UPI003D8F6F4F
MSGSEAHPAPGARHSWARERDNLLADLVAGTLVDFGAEAVAVYLHTPEASCLSAAVVAVTPMGVGMVERIPLGNYAYPSARAYDTGEIVTASSAPVQGEQPELAFLPFPYLVAAAPLVVEDRRIGTLSVCWLQADQPVREEAIEALGGRAADAGSQLAGIVDSGASLVPPAVPLAVAARVETPFASAAPFIFHLHKLAVLLASARSSREVVELTIERVTSGFRAQAALLTLIEGEQLRVVGASGCADGYVRSLREAPLRGNSPEARAATTLTHVVYGPKDPVTLGRCAAAEVADEDVTWVVLPLGSGGHALGTCSMGFGPRDRAVTAEPSILAALSAMLGQAFDRTQLHDAQHALAANLQEALLPRVLPQLPGVVSTSRYLPATSGIEVGGDWYDLIHLPDGSVTIVIGDVQGHNTAAAVVMGQLRSVVQAYAAEGHGPAAVLARTNRLLVRLNTDLFATCCCMALDPDTGVARLATAGHPLPLIRTGNGEYPPIDLETGIPLGVDPTADFPESEHTLPPGTLIVFYSDGLFGPAVPFPPHRLETALTQANGDLESLADRIITPGSTPSARRRDDAALQVVRYEGPSAAAQSSVRQLELNRRDLQGPRHARELLRQWLSDWQLTPMTAEAELLVCEVVTNGLVHGDSDVFLCVRRYPHTLRVEVRDSNPRPAHAIALPGTEDEAEGGRGLLIVSTLATVWGNSPSGRGKTVWFELPTST